MPHRPLALIAAVMTSGIGAIADELRPAENAWAEPVAVEASLRITGEVTGEGASDPTPVAVEARLDYFQQGLTGADERTVARRCVRVESSVAKGEPLREERRLLTARSGAAGVEVAAVGGPLKRAELDRVRWAADPLAIDGLLPAGEVREGSTWKIEPDAARRLMGLDTTELVEITAIVSDLTTKHARLRFAGPVHGLNDGVKTEIDLRGVALFDRTAGRLTRLNLAWSESRKLSAATPALDATAKLNLVVRPAGDDERLTADELRLAAAAPRDERLLVEAADGSWSLLAERDWFVVGQDHRVTTLRQMGAEGALAQTTLVRREGKPLEMDAFRREVRYALGKGLTQVLGSSESQSNQGLRRLTVESSGQIDRAPTAWRHHQLSGPDGVLLITTTIPLEGERSADEAGSLVEAIRFGSTRTASGGDRPLSR